MHQTATPPAPSVAIPPRDWGRTAFSWLVWGGLIVVLAWGFEPAEIYRAVNLITDAGNMAEYASGFLSPNFRVSTITFPRSS
jgi:phosphonate transport system permease protein